MLRYKGEHSWIYLQDRAQVADAAITRTGEDFDTQIYPKLTTEFGLPPMPGIDGDPRITILLADLHGSGGYFTQIDDEPSAIERTSNQRKMIYIDLSSAQPGSAAFDGYLAHEFQHLLNFARHPGSQSWINEGLSEVAREQFTNSLLNIPSFEDRPDTQLNDWPAIDDGTPLPHYGAAHSFLRYLLLHYGGVEQAGTLAAEAGDGIAQVRAYLASGGFGVSFEDVFADWLVANLLNDRTGGRYSQSNPAIGVHGVDSLTVPSSTEGNVHQFGARYFAIETGGRPLTLNFSGASTVAPTPALEATGGPIWWSSRGDSIDTTLTRPIDLGAVGQATLQFASWYEIERDFDYGYVEVSTDGGTSWTALRGAHSSDENPLGIALGPAYTGVSGGGSQPVWIDETVDLSSYAGRKILVRFEYVTDESANRNGWAIARVRVPEIGFSDPPASDQAWVAEGFTRVDSEFPQRFIVQAVLTGSDGTSVQRLSLDSDNHSSLSVRAGVRRVVLIVSGATDLIRTLASFRIDAN